MSAAQPPARFAELDALRAVAVLLVLWLHAAELLLPRLETVAGLEAALHRAAIALDVGRVGVVAFFCLSGYLIPFTFRGTGRRGAASFALRRLTRLYPAYLASLPLAVAVLAFGFGRPVDGAMLAANLTLVPGLLNTPALLGHYWTLTVELVFYTLCLGLFALGRERDGAALAMVMLGAAAGLAVLLSLSGNSTREDSVALDTAQRVALFLVPMAWGALVRLWREGALPNPWLRRLVVGFAAGCGLAVVLGLAAWQAGLPRRLVVNLFGNGGGVLLFLLALGFKPSGAALRALGRVSYSFYLVHPLPLYGLVALMEAGHIRLPGPTPVLIATLAAGILAGLLALILYRFVEKPAMDWGHARASQVEAASSRPMSSPTTLR